MKDFGQELVQTAHTAPLLSDFAQQGAVYAGLMKSFQDDRAVHAYLISGAEGCGKRTLARLMAQYLLCRGEQKPCGKCISCQQMANDNHPDVLYVRPEKSVIKVDVIRDTVIPKVSEHTYEGGRRIVMIEQAEKMNASAQNSLLKTLEEPVDGTVFLLTTDAPALLLPTIISRVREIKLHPWPGDYIFRVLTNRGVAEDRARDAVQVCGGSIGHALAVAQDEKYWQRRQDVMKDFFSLTSRSDILRVSGQWKDRKEEAGELLDDIDDMIRMLLLVRLGQADANTIAAFTQPWQRMAREGDTADFIILKDAVCDARWLRQNQVTWQAVVERLLLRIMEEQSKWST